MLWWNRSRIAGGWLYELAGEASVDVETLLPAGERLEVADVVRGMRRIAVRGASGGLEGALFITRNGQLPPRDWVAAQLGEAGAASEWLAGRPSAPAPDRGPVVCVCFGVGEKDILGAGCTTVAKVGAATQAGTNCGSCRPAIARLLAAAAKEAA